MVLALVHVILTVKTDSVAKQLVLPWNSLNVCPKNMHNKKTKNNNPSTQNPEAVYSDKLGLEKKRKKQNSEEGISALSTQNNSKSKQTK